MAQLPDDTWRYIRDISGWSKQMFTIYRCCLIDNCRYSHVDRHFHDTRTLPGKCVSSKHLIGWAGSLGEAQHLAQHFHDAKYCGKRTFGYLINVYPFPHVLSKQPRGQQREYVASASHVAMPKPKHQPLVWQRLARPTRVAKSIS